MGEVKIREKSPLEIEVTDDDGKTDCRTYPGIQLDRVVVDVGPNRRPNNWVPAPTGTPNNPGPPEWVSKIVLGGRSTDETIGAGTGSGSKDPTESPPE